MHGYWSMGGANWGISLKYKCATCSTELIACPGNQKRWEDQMPNLIVWDRFLSD